MGIPMSTTNPIPLIEMLIDFINELEKHKLSYAEARIHLEKTIEIIKNTRKNDTNAESFKEETKQSVVEDTKDDK